MSTHCGIAIKTETGYKSIYCHHDGYPEYMWETLNACYDSKELAEKMISLGDASSIQLVLEPTTETHSFDNPEDDVCIFYGRDRGEDWKYVAPKHHDTLRDFTSQYYYAYIWGEDGWEFYKNGKRVC